MIDNLLKALIRETLLHSVLNESSSPVAKADAEGLAVLLDMGGVRTDIIIYDPAKMQLYLDNAFEGDLNHIYPSELRDAGVIRAGVSFLTSKLSLSSGPCNNSAIIIRSVSFKDSGMGPAAYDIAMLLNKQGITSDRESVSQSAYNVWKKYDKRADVEKTKFDDIENPKTPPVEDDCSMHKGQPSLNKSYKLSSEPPGLASMIARHDNFYAKATADGVKHLNSQLSAAFRMLFNKRYDG